ncbi:hypothetical protein B2J88_45295 [Rhodococcus sp. SRB_17]|nr:hypothetical protein [Rhodococcus sp. SRB_17]
MNELASDPQLGAAPLEYNPLDPTVKQDPYPIYRQLRLQNPVHRSPIGIWFVADRQNCDRILRSRDFGKDFANSTFVAQLTAAVGADMAPFLGLGIDGDARAFMLTDPPEHTRLRGLVATAFTRAESRVIESAIGEVVARAIKSLETTADFISEIAEPLPVEILSLVLGIPSEDQEKFNGWCSAVAGALEVDFALPRPLAQLRQDAIDQALSYFRDLVTNESVGAGLIRELMLAGDTADRLSIDEIAATCLLITIAAQETVSNALGNMLVCFSRNPDQYQLLRSGGAEVDAAVAEVLRYEPPVHMAARIALVDVTIDGQEIRRGDSVMLLVASANRESVPDGETFRVDRDHSSMLSYGRGIHYCLGSTLANATLAKFLSAIIEGYSKIIVAEPLEYKPGLALRGAQNMQVAFVPASD